MLQAMAIARLKEDKFNDLKQYFKTSWQRPLSDVTINKTKLNIYIIYSIQTSSMDKKLYTLFLVSGGYIMP